ncbi:winged helix-turn-helix domain-containing protein [Pseudalkalibacillus hwajinpoensis]|uniref:Winged helix-turn-helix domain-containing protein n=1 Tax=Guptibacillus hwajinpoensis TaxID=208199 RepID=A0A4V5Q0D8_9BACL|nr:winged helix-turn-helix domain-containing protein [Pseudalkalibacillus hwajinpoensis]TKD65708.1 winged helix-turn-helix domain-containing protein [Pseudalkalibacillus hwajinpoensis]
MENATTLKKAQHHTWFHHKDSTGYITLARKEKNRFVQYHYKPSELADNLSKWLGEDIYFSQNTFYKPSRQIESIRELRSLYVDTDCYLLNLDPQWLLGKLQLEFFDQLIPEPNIIIFSGQGLVLIWLIDPVPYKALPLWQAVQQYLLNQLKEFGGDAKASDAARIFRIDGSVNSKNGEEVHVEYRHDYRYTLRTLQEEYLPVLETQKTPIKRGRPKKVQQLFNTYSLHHARLLDLVKLVELRNYDVTGYRELICFLYRYWQCCYLADPAEAIHQTLFFNSQFKEPLPEKEVLRATKSAQKAWDAKSSEEANRLAKEKGYPGAGYNLKNSTIIEWLDITEEEQSHLKTLIGSLEKRKRNTIAKREKRREEGVRTREEYIGEQKEKTLDKLFLLNKALNRYPDATQKELAEKMGVSVRHIKRLLKRLKENK